MDRWRLRFWILLAIVAGVPLLIGIVLAMRFLPDRPVTHANIEDHFKYGSTGGERNAGYPLWMWKALPVVFADKLPKNGREGYEAFGMVYEDESGVVYEGDDRGRRGELPVGMMKRRHLGIDRVFVNCAAATPPRCARRRTSGRSSTSPRGRHASISDCSRPTCTGKGESDMKFGIHIGHMGGPLAEMRKLWKFADAKGFDWFSVSDHFQESPPRGGEMDCYEAIATLTAAAMDTSHVRLGSGVYCVVYRNPGLLAKSLTTIDHLSNGRVDCGLGAGWHDVEAKAFGYPFPTIGPREDMLEEYAQIMRLLLDPEQRRASFEGKHFRVANAPNNPKPLQPRIPIWIGGRGEKRTLRAAAKYADGWNGAYIGPEDWAHKGRVLDQWCETEKRDPKTIMRTVNLGFYLGVDAKGGARAEETFQRHFGGNDRADRTGYLRGTVKDAHAMVDQFRALGCTRLSIAFREGPYDWEALEAFAAEIVRPG